jgi:hypothetical protein
MHRQRQTVTPNALCSCDGLPGRHTSGLGARQKVAESARPHPYFDQRTNGTEVPEDPRPRFFLAGRSAAAGLCSFASVSTTAAVTWSVDTSIVLAAAAIRARSTAASPASVTGMSNPSTMFGPIDRAWQMRNVSTTLIQPGLKFRLGLVAWVERPLAGSGDRFPIVTLPC